ncbi:hypothetical protein Agub_g7325 [Astrephomene gubernaculifera]|uniref:Uncharacterized protein n=1 Tax=Astrephomene gubernaculifera TaxID=47775 RepID=A0AAD3HM93_9CHLO|nr:hypothetical protein Agub_g7325 [Astrephomene gubernaculifera]
MNGLIRDRTMSALFFILLCTLSGRLAFAADPYVSLTTDDGTTYSFHRTDDPISSVGAAEACAALGGQLASFTSRDQVLASLWSQQVVDAAASADTTLLWTGLKISWPPAGTINRRMLRDNLAGVADHDSEELLARLMDQMEASNDPVPTTTRDGRMIPQLVRAWMFQQNQQRSLLEKQTSAISGFAIGRRGLSSAGSDSDESPYLKNAQLTWADGSDTDFILSNPTNMGFLACNRKKVSECCGAVFDIGPDPYPGAEFPTVFFYPCNSSKISGASPPSGFICQVDPVAELEAPMAPSPSPATKACRAGFATITKGGSITCKRCKANTYSADGLACKKCPAGKKSGRGASKCT